MKIAQCIIELPIVDLKLNSLFFKRALVNVKKNQALKNQISSKGFEKPISITPKNFLCNSYNEVAMAKLLKVNFLPAIYIPYKLTEHEEELILEHNFRNTLSQNMILSSALKVKVLSILFPLFYNVTGQFKGINQKELLEEIASYANISIRQVQRTKKIYQSALVISENRKKDQLIKMTDIEKVIQSLNKKRKTTTPKSNKSIFKKLEEFYYNQNKKRKKEIRSELKSLIKKSNDASYSLE